MSRILGAQLSMVKVALQSIYDAKKNKKNEINNTQSIVAAGASRFPKRMLYPSRSVRGLGGEKRVEKEFMTVQLK